MTKDPPTLPEGPICEPCGRPMIIHRETASASCLIVRIFRCTVCQSVAVVEVDAARKKEKQPAES